MSTESRRDYRAEPGLLDRVFRLLETAWPGITEVRDRAAGYGCDWAESIPFVAEEDGEVVGHVGLLELAYMVDGVPLRAAGIHAVTTRDDHRGRGIARRLLTEAVAHGERDHPTLVLFADLAGVYEPHGFRIVPRHRFTGRWEGAPRDRGPRLRKADPESEADRRFVREVLARRIPVSRRLGAGPDPLCFGFFAANRVPWLAPDDGLVVYAREGDGETVLEDVVASAPVERDAILAGIGAPAGPVRYMFTPDLLDPDAEAVRLPEDEDLCMVRGAWIDPAVRVDLPISGWC